MIEVGEAKKGLNVFDFLGNGPVPYDLNFCIIHADAIRTDNETQEVSSVNVKLAFFNFGVEIVCVKVVKHLVNVILVLGRIVGEDEYVVRINNHTHIQHVLEDIVHKSLKGGQSICESIMHDKKLIGSVSCAKGGLPFVSVCDANEIVSTA